MEIFAEMLEGRKRRKEGGVGNKIQLYSERCIPQKLLAGKLP